MSESPRKLTFRNNEFVFENGYMNDITQIFRDDCWRAINPDDYATTNAIAAARFRRFADKVAEKVLERTLVKHYPVPSFPPLPFLDPHQMEGIKWILTRSRSYLAHAPGAGKTAQAIIASHFAQGTGQIVFIVPPDLTLNWAREIVKWTEWRGIWPTVSIVPVTNRKASLEWRSEFIICPDSMLTKPWVYERLLALPKSFIAVDEASRFKDPSSERTKALFGGTAKSGFQYAGLIQDSPYTVLLDGSPMPNRPMELWAPTYAMAGEAIDFMSQQDFGLRYCGATVNDRGHWEFKFSSNEAELNKRLTKSFMHVVLESKLKHPERLRTILPMSKDPRSPEQKIWDKKNIHTIGFDSPSEDLSQGAIATARRELGIAKVDWAVSYIASRIREKNESVLVYCWHREVGERLLAELAEYAPALILGGLPKHFREEHIKNFQSGERKVLIASIAAMARGHNIQRAERVVFVEPSWSDELNRQCEKRASRKGSKHEFVRCDYLMVPGSLDEPVLKSLFRKEESTKKVIG